MANAAQFGRYGNTIRALFLARAAPGAPQAGGAAKAGCRFIEGNARMRTVSILGLGVIGVLCALPAEALTISNSDADAHTITVTEGSDSKEVTIEPQTEVDPPCDKGCTVGLESGEQYEMKGDETASIEDGTLFVDNAPGAQGDDNVDVGEEPGDSSDSGSADKAEAPPADNAPTGATSQAQ